MQNIPTAGSTTNDNDSYKLSCRSVLITWPQSADLNQDEVLDRIQDILAATIQYSVAGKEVHATTGGNHIHAYVVLERKCNVRNAGRRFTIRGNKPNFAVSRVNRHSTAIAYVKKDGDWKERGIPPVEKKPNNKSETFLRHKEESQDAHSLIQKLLSDPVTAFDAVRSFSNVSRAADYLFPGTRVGGSAFSIEQFDVPPSLKNWVFENMVCTL